MGPDFDRYIPLVGAIFISSLVSNLISLVGIWSPTADLMTELAWGLVVFVLITYHKIKASGLGGYLKGFLDPLFVLAPINVMAECFTPISMACRHFGNILSGIVINGLIYAALAIASGALLGLIPGAVGDFLGNIPILSVGLPAVLSVYFDWFTGAMQAFIFTMLTIMYIANAAEG
jgi:F-type H+-transporting ATPase subunit a